MQAQAQQQKTPRKSNLNPNSQHIKKKQRPPAKKFPQKNRPNKKQETTEAPSNTPTNPLEELYQKAKRIYEQREKQILDKSGKRGDAMLMKRILDSGTLADKVSALSIRVKDHPKFCVDSVVRLLSITKAENKRKNLLATDALKELFLNVLLQDKKLNTFATLAKQREKPNDDELVAFYLEHRIKELYSVYIKSLENGLRHELDYFKENSTRILGEMLKSKPEQESTILGLLVNKFGDKNKKYITTLNKVLLDVLFRHKSMTIVVAKEIENFVHRPNISNDAVFYALNFLSMLNFELLNHEALVYLSKLLFTVFFKFTDVKEDENEKIHRIQSILLKSLNKIFPNIKELDPSANQAIEEHIDQLFKMSHQCTLKVRIQALVLLFQFLKSRSAIPDRFYRIIYEVLLLEELKVNTSCQQFYDVLYNSLKEDFSLPRVKAFLKRILHAALHAEAPFIISSLLLVAKLFQAHPGALSLLQFSDHNKFKDEDDEEVFRDVPDPDGDMNEDITEKPSKNVKKNILLPSTDDQEKKGNPSLYDPEKREPLYAGAENSYLFELLILKEHYHPTVRLYANKILEGVKKNAGVFEYNGNPWLDHSLSNFLDRIAFKKPKKISDSKQNKMRLSRLAPPISETFIPGEDVRADEEYFVKYFQNRVPRKSKGGEANEEADMDAYADRIFEEQLKGGEEDDDDDDDFWDDDEDFGEDGEDEGEFEDDDGQAFENMLGNIGEDENDFDDDFE